MKITVKKIMSWNPCEENYDEARVKELIGNGKTPLEICNLKIPAEDRLWVFLRSEMIPENDLHEMACKFAENALKAERKAGREPHPDSWEVIKVKRLWINKKATDEQLKIARAAAWSAENDAAWAAGREAAWEAARAAARSAADSAAWSAGRSAAWAAKRSAVWAAKSAAAWEAERKKQINIVKRYFKKGN